MLARPSSCARLSLKTGSSIHAGQAKLAGRALDTLNADGAGPAQLATLSPGPHLAVLAPLPLAAGVAIRALQKKIKIKIFVTRNLFEVLVKLSYYAIFFILFAPEQRGENLFIILAALIIYVLRNKSDI